MGVEQGGFAEQLVAFGPVLGIGAELDFAEHLVAVGFVLGMALEPAQNDYALAADETAEVLAVHTA